MSVSDPVADMLTKVRNASSAGFEMVDVFSSKLKEEILKVLESEGYIQGFKKINNDGKETLRVFLKYDANNKPVIKGIQRVSTPGRRVYAGYKKIPRVFNGYGTIIVSTSAGIVTGRKAAEQQVGGELVCTVW